jgi:hypothetical protein
LSRSAEQIPALAVWHEGPDRHVALPRAALSENRRRSAVQDRLRSRFENL